MGEMKLSVWAQSCSLTGMSSRFTLASGVPAGAGHRRAYGEVTTMAAKSGLTVKSGL